MFPDLPEEVAALPPHPARFSPPVEVADGSVPPPSIAGRVLAAQRGYVRVAAALNAAAAAADRRDWDRARACWAVLDATFLPFGLSAEPVVDGARVAALRVTLPPDPRPETGGHTLVAVAADRSLPPVPAGMRIDL